MARLYDPNNVLLMDGTAAILDLISGAAFTMAGTATTASLLGAIAPTISATAYTTATIATPYVAGSAISILAVVNTAWAGNDGVDHYIFVNRFSGNQFLFVYKTAANNLEIYTYNNAGGNGKEQRIATNATNWAAGTHIVIGTADASNNQQIFLDGVAGTTTVGTGSREVSVGATCTIGNHPTATTNYITGSILCAVWTRVLSAAEITALSAMTTWTTLTNQLATGQPRIERRRRLHVVTG